ncbi:MAG TPA: aspartate/glutamate racemase family protein [Beijerinckiaceae bacterium]|nr:aspartate/glutamate racemase family protein [Beijerinckiaceae bacterium]
MNIAAPSPSGLSPNEEVSLATSTGFARARLGLIIPSSNRLTEPQFRRFAPPDLGLHVTRLQMTGKHRKPLADLFDDIARAAEALADADVDLLVFHCTATSMEEGPDGDARILETITRATGRPALSTAQAVSAALNALGIRRLVMVSPYPQSNNDHERAYLSAMGFEVLHDVALGLTSNGYIKVSPQRWIEIVRANAREAADGYFLSCTNTTQIDAIAPLEAEFAKPFVNSNQATIWAALERLRDKLAPFVPATELGQLARKKD